MNNRLENNIKKIKILYKTKKIKNNWKNIVLLYDLNNTENKTFFQFTLFCSWEFLTFKGLVLGLLWIP